MINFEDYKKENGDIDWKAYKAAQIAAGERCPKCDSRMSTLFNNKKYEHLCSECESLAENEELSHSSYIRCPKCKESWDPSDREDYDCYQDGEHSVTCSSCNHEFEVSTSVSYLFTSPELLDQGEKNETQEQS
jgi:DNA-directed RNA polymerase subunit RPC12/RpoP